MGLEARQTVRVANGQVKWSQPVERVPSAARNQSSMAMALMQGSVRSSSGFSLLMGVVISGGVSMIEYLKWWKWLEMVRIRLPVVNWALCFLWFFYFKRS